ncbi:MAG: tetratricopeptide repeat protein [Bacteroidetes bacterium]|nr:tetratricopeptide repeat protein [Bacteroidota bacterium]
MKIISAIVLSFMVFTSVVNAQNSKVTTAANARYAGEYDKAKQAIDEAILNEKTSVQAKTWVIRGDIHNDIAKDTTGKYSNIANPLDAAFESFKTALTMEDSKNYKVKVAEGLFTTYNLFFMKGLDAYNAGNIEDAYKNFYMANQANMIQMDANPLAILDTGVFYNMGLMAERLGKNAEAIAVYQKLLDIKYEDKDLYTKLSNLYTEGGRADEALKILEAGRAAMPNDKDIMIAELNYYINANKLDILVTKLESAIALDPKNTDLYFVLGTTHGELIKLDSTNGKMHFDAAIVAYDKALALDPNRFDINLNAGALFYNTAIEMNKVMNSLPLEKEKEYESLKVERNKLYSRALPYFENAYKIDPTNTDCMLALKEIYVRLDMKEKADEMKAKLGN